MHLHGGPRQPGHAIFSDRLRLPGCDDQARQVGRARWVNQPFTYDIRVTNVSKYDLWDVVVTDTAPQVVKIDGSTPQADMSAARAG